jgi:hypothetical protein
MTDSTPSCPLCGYLGEVEDRFFTWFTTDNGVDPTMIARLQDSGGMCVAHTRRVLAQPGAGGRLTTVYRHVLPALRARLAADRSATGACPACHSLQRATAAALERAGAPAAIPADVCLPHLRQAGHAAPRAMAALAPATLGRLSRPDLTLAALAGVDPDREPRARLRALLPHDGMLAETDADPADTPSRLHARLQVGTCPLCLTEGQHERRYLAWLTDEAHRNPDGIGNEPGGLCPRHLHDLATGDPAAGVWALHRERARWAGRFADAGRGRPRAVRAGLRAALRDDTCLVCGAVADATAGETALLLAGLAASPALHTAFAEAGGLCLRHTRATPAAGAVAAMIRQTALARADLIGAELNEAARKTAWLFRYEGRGPETTAWARAAALIDGSVFLGGPADPTYSRSSSRR